MENADNPSEKNAPQPLFTIDPSDSSEQSMPSISRLLARKRLGDVAPPPFTKKSEAQKDTVPSPDDPTLTFPEPPAPRGKPASPAHPVAKKAGRRAGSTQKLIQWDVELLQQGGDPMGKALIQLLGKGIQSALFLGITPPPTDSPVPHFLATATVLPQNKLEIWTGMRWIPTVDAALWNEFVRSGLLEFGPPGTQTNMKSNRNIARAAFGITPDEWLTLVRVGPIQMARGVLALVSKKSVASEVTAVAELLNATIGMKKG